VCGRVRGEGGEGGGGDGGRKRSQSTPACRKGRGLQCIL